MYFLPFAKKNKLKFDQDFKACWSFCFELKVLNESKFSMPWPLCLWQCIKTNRETKIFETGIETLYETKSFKSITCISLENDTAEEELFLRPKFLRPIPRLFFETKIFETETDTLKKFSLKKSLSLGFEKIGLKKVSVSVSKNLLSIKSRYWSQKSLGTGLG